MHMYNIINVGRRTVVQFKVLLPSSNRRRAIFLSPKSWEAGPAGANTTPWLGDEIDQPVSQETGGDEPNHGMQECFARWNRIQSCTLLPLVSCEVRKVTVLTHVFGAIDGLPERQTSHSKKHKAS